MLEASLKTMILAAVTGTVPSERIYWAAAPQDAAHPYIKFMEIDEQEEQTNDGLLGHVDSLVQINVYSKTALEAKDLRRAIKLQMDKYRAEQVDNGTATGAVIIETIYEGGGLDSYQLNEDSDEYEFDARQDWRIIHCEDRP